VTRARALGARLVQLADEDATAYRAFMSERNEGTRAEIIRVPREIATHADAVAEIADGLRGRLKPSVAGDAEAGAELARAAARVARRLAEINA